MKLTFALILALGFSLVPIHGQNFDQIAPKVPSKDGNQDDSASQTGSQISQPGDVTTQTAKAGPKKVVHNEELLANLKGLVFVGNAKDIQKSGVSGVTGVKADGLPLLQIREFHSVTDKYLGHSLSMSDLNSLVRDVIVYYKQHDRPIVDVSVPEQDVTTGVVQIVAVEGRLGQVRVEGNRWFSTKSLAGEIRLQPDDPISGETVTQDAVYLNTNPFRQVDLVYAAGSQPGTTDIILKTKDRFPFRVYTGYENSGNQYTGYNRFLAGFNWGNAFGLGQQLNYQFTTNNQYDLYNAQSGSWIIPLPWRHTLTFFGSYSQAQPDTNNAFFSQDGYSWQVSGRYTIPLPSVGTFDEELVFGADFKRSNSNLFFGQAQVFGSLVDVDQFMVGYNASQTDRFGSTSFNSSFIYSPGGITEYNHDSNFQSTQPGTKANYFYALLQLNRITKLPGDFSLATKIIGQATGDDLVGSEQFGIGGYSTIRGYDEREVNGNSGVIVSNEIRSPAISLGQFMGIDHATDQLQFLAFADFGTVSGSTKITGPGTNGTLLGVGPGLRYVINPYFSMRADYGFQMEDANVPGITGNSRGEFGAILSY